MSHLTDALVQFAAAVISLAAAIVSAYVIPLVKARFTEQQLGNLRALASIAVQATEAAAAAGLVHLPKKEDAATRLKALAAAHGLTLTDQQVDSLIEEAVLELKRLGYEIVGSGANAPAPAQVNQSAGA
ncbi:MAG: phage holin, LLH family [Bacillota bacterium]|nr:phage holin, LLH family [Bacillota bacterium]